LFCAGLAVGHVRDAVVAHDFAPNNFGLLLPVMAPAFQLEMWPSASSM
ncbi:MAG: hypothetical protein K0S56_4475, partial [Microvirga sp.]|jgi:hypothetical protein|nr:hypothetical protein [Microvirga sp.]